MKRLTSFARTPFGRLLAVAIGLSAVGFLVERAGPAAVWTAITRAPLLFPVIVLLEAVVVGSETWCAFLLYGRERAKIPFREAIRSSLFCYAVMAALPFGRAAGEAARVALLSKYVGFPRAAATAAQMQGVTLLGNALLSIPCAIAVLWLVGPGWMLAAICGNFVVTAALGCGVLLAARHTRLGTRISKYFRSGDEWGSALDEHLQSELKLGGPLLWVVFSRCALTAQRAVMLAAVGGGFGLLQSLVSSGVSMVSSAVGDAIPAQVGVAEAAYAVTSKVLSLSASDAIAMALLVHLAQLFWVGVGFVTPLLSPSRDPQPAGPVEAAPLLPPR